MEFIYRDNEGKETVFMREVGETSSKMFFDEASVSKLIRNTMNKVNKKKNRLVKPSKFDIAEIMGKMLFHANQPFARSTDIARYFGMEHKTLLRKIKGFYSFDDLISRRKIVPSNRVIRGKEFEYFELDSDSFAFTCLSMTGRKAEKFKWAFIEAFKISTREALKNKMRAEIHLEDEEFIQIRNEGKVVRLDLTDAIKYLCEDAESTRGKKYGGKGCPYYKHFTDLVYKSLGLEKPLGNVDRRTVFNKGQLKALEELEAEVAEAIVVMVDDFMEYHDVFQHIKSELVA